MPATACMVQAMRVRNHIVALANREQAAGQALHMKSLAAIINFGIADTLARAPTGPTPVDLYQHYVYNLLAGAVDDSMQGGRNDLAKDMVATAQAEWTSLFGQKSALFRAWRVLATDPVCPGLPRVGLVTGDKAAELLPSALADALVQNWQRIADEARGMAIG